VRNALVVTSIDGLATLECGIASIVHWFFEEIELIEQRVPQLQTPDWSLYALCPEIDRASSDYSEEVYRIVSEACIAREGGFRWFPVVDATNLRSVWSLDKPERWNNMCSALADEIRELSHQHEQVTVLVHGVMLTAVREYIEDLNNVQVVFIAHSLGRVFEDKASSSRAIFEDRGFQAMAKHTQDRVGYIGEYFQNILTDRYGRTESQLAPFINGLPESSFRFPLKPTDEERISYLAQAGVPLGKKLMFSWGRCTGQKGYDVLIPALREFYADSVSADWHTVLLMPQEVSPPEYIELLDQQLQSLPQGSVTVLRAFDALLPYYLLQDDALSMVVFASRFEGAPLTLLETLRYGDSDLRVVWHDIPSMRQFLGNAGKTFDFSTLQPSEVVEALRQARDESDGPLLTASVGSFSENTSEGLASVLQWWH
jgi:glycosyltransferase involved in cell wall biosynthesis